MFRTIDDLLNGITMYRLVLYGLAALAAIGIGLGFIGQLGLPAGAMIISLGLLLLVCYSGNRFLSWAWRVPSNSESSLITALVLFCLLPPATTWPRAMGIAAAGIIAVASKYLLTWHAKHIFNPAAIAVLIVGLIGIVPVTWWVGSRAMLPFTLLVGLLVTWTVRRWHLLSSFAVAALAVLLFIGIRHGQEAHMIITGAFTSWPLVFFGTIMLTEPATMPPRRKQSVLYGALVGALFASQLHVGDVSATPQAALIIGNMYTFMVGIRRNVRMTFVGKRQLTPTIYDFSFAPDHRFSFLPGQYMEWTIPHGTADGRGNRRTFTIASSPTEPAVHIGVKFYEPASSFKQALLAMQPGDTIVAGQLAGDFVLPRDPRQKLVCIAGGVGITPFCSMLTDLVATGRTRDVVLLYFVKRHQEVAYRDKLRQAAKHGVRTKILQGALQPDAIIQAAGDYQERLFYISGPPGMVRAHGAVLRSMGVPGNRIVSDYFSGY
jgi:glycine betaine catabolism B